MLAMAREGCRCERRQATPVPGGFLWSAATAACHIEGALEAPDRESACLSCERRIGAAATVASPGALLSARMS
jgi:hypothetical protein